MKTFQTSLKHSLTNNDELCDTNSDANFTTLQSDIREQLMWLFNTRLNQKTANFDRSLLNYGMENFHYSKNDDNFCAKIKLMIEAFEPRLHKIQVHIIKDHATNFRDINCIFLRIEGVLYIKNHTQKIILEPLWHSIKQKIIFE